jgi:hypothetical protein
VLTEEDTRNSLLAEISNLRVLGDSRLALERADAYLAIAANAGAEFVRGAAIGAAEQHGDHAAAERLARAGIAIKPTAALWLSLGDACVRQGRTA